MMKKKKMSSMSDADIKIAERIEKATGHEMSAREKFKEGMKKGK